VPGFLKSMRVLSDEGRVRVLRLVQQEELSVADLQEILSMGQSRISMQLSQLKQAGFVEVRRAGQKSLYRFTAPAGTEDLLAETLSHSSRELREARQDDEALQLVLLKRKDKLRAYFDELAGRFGRNYIPGRSWKGLSEVLLRLLPPLTIADLGAGEGTLALMLAQRSDRVIAVDSSQKMVEYGMGVAERNGIQNLEYRLGDLEELPIDASQVDVALLHQSLHHALHPQRAVDEAWRILRPGGRIVILDLLKHGFEQARELYADVWLGFSKVELLELLRKSHFDSAEITPVDREPEPPHFEVILATAAKPLQSCGCKPIRNCGRKETDSA
jgi:ubiquinone/menaquinone biosynthesis C-methylase UbiE/predicted transcriptional regulator